MSKKPEPVSIEAPIVIDRIADTGNLIIENEVQRLGTDLLSEIQGKSKLNRRNSEEDLFEYELANSNLEYISYTLWIPENKTVFSKTGRAQIDDFAGKKPGLFGTNEYEYEAIDALPWKAKEAYRSLDQPNNHLLIYEDCILEIDSNIPLVDEYKRKLGEIIMSLS